MAKPLVCLSATTACTFGVTPSTLVPTPSTILGESKPAATIMDVVPLVNIMPFGMCTTLSNPTVAAATAAALGVLTPMPCIPVVPAPWAPGSPMVLLGGKPALLADSKAMCAWGGVISLTFPGTTKTMA